MHHATIDGASGALMLAAILDTEPDAAHTGEPAAWSPDRVPTDQELLQRTLVQYLRSPEKFIRLSVRTLRELSSATGSSGLRAMADVVAQPMPGPLGDLLRQPAARIAERGRRPARTAADRGATHAVERVDHAAPPLRLHDDPARGRQEDPPRQLVARSTTS